jgi:RNase P protein component
MASNPKVKIEDPKHLIRFLKYEAAGADEAAIALIAKEEKVSAAVVRNSVTRVASFRQSNTSAEMDLAIRDLVISTIPQAKATLQGLLTATELVETKVGNTGRTKVVSVPDKTTRLEAMKVVNQLVASLQPKQAPVQVAVNQTNQMAATLGKGETPEERMRRLRERAKEYNALPPEIAGVPDHIDSGEDADDYDDDEEEEEDDE